MNPMNGFAEKMPARLTKEMYLESGAKPHAGAVGHAWLPWRFLR